jgi:peptidoglycan/LPS O-acetylase OafA/YrhL
LQPWIFGQKYVQLVHVFAWGSVTSIMYFGWLLLLIHGDTEGWLSRALSFRIFRPIATLGYGVYLVHIPLCDYVIVPFARSLEAHHWPMTIVWPLSLVLLLASSLAVGYVMHIAIEKPSLWVRQKLAG